MCLCECLDIRVSELQLFSVSGIGSDCDSADHLVT